MTPGVRRATTGSPKAADGWAGGYAMCHRTRLAAATTLALLAVPGRAADGVVDDGSIVVTGRQTDALTLPAITGSRLGLTPLETPASIATLDGDAIRRRGDLTIVEAVTRAPGVTTGANPGNGGTALVVRGFSGQGSILQLYDGIRLFPVAGTITFPTDPWTVDRIEVLNGPASVLYGQGALGGAVNVLARQPHPDRFVADGELQFGSQNTVHAGAGIGGPLADKLSFRADASYRRSDGYVDRGRSTSYALSAALRFAPTETLSLTLRDDYGDQRPIRYFGTPLIDHRLDERNRGKNYNVDDAQLHYQDNRTTLTLDWTPTPAVTVSNAAYRLTSKRLFKDLESYFYDDDTGRVDRFDNLGIVHDQTQYGDQGTVRWSVPLGRLKNDLVVGFDVNSIKLVYSNDFGSDPQADSVDPFDFSPGVFFDTQGIAPRYRTQTTEYAVFAEDRLKLTDQVSLIAGVRTEHDQVGRWNTAYAANGATSETPAYPNGQDKVLQNTTYRVGGVYQPVPTVSLYAQYSTGVDPLGTLTTFTTNATQFFFTNATGEQVEVGAKVGFLSGHGAATVAAYKITKHNLVAQRTPDSPVEQIGARSSRGIEASVALDLAAGFGLDANGTVLDARYDDFVSGGTSYTGRTPANIPETSVNLYLRYDATRRLQVRGGLRYIGRSFSDDANTFRVPGYVVFDLGLTYAITRSIAANVHVENLTDKAYATTTYNDEQWILGRPRSVDMSLTARF